MSDIESQEDCSITPKNAEGYNVSDFSTAAATNKVKYRKGNHSVTKKKRNKTNKKQKNNNNIVGI
jgi:hypothetical protein